MVVGFLKSLATHKPAQTTLLSKASTIAAESCALMGSGGKGAQATCTCRVNFETGLGSGGRAKVRHRNVTVSTGGLVTYCVATVADMPPESNSTVRLAYLEGGGVVELDQLHQVG